MKDNKILTQELLDMVRDMGEFAETYYAACVMERMMEAEYSKKSEEELTPKFLRSRRMAELLKEVALESCNKCEGDIMEWGTKNRVTPPLLFTLIEGSGLSDSTIADLILLVLSWCTPPAIRLEDILLTVEARLPHRSESPDGGS